MNNKPEKHCYNCFYCSEPSNLEELLEVDKKLNKMDSENHEFLLDYLQNSSNPRIFPFTHQCDLGYEVLNICANCFKRAKKHLNEE
ncbi:MAG: hypothetical protein ACTSRZ_20570 [Promethearchaeota archaeon]